MTRRPQADHGRSCCLQPADLNVEDNTVVVVGDVAVIVRWSVDEWLTLCDAMQK